MNVEYNAGSNSRPRIHMSQENWVQIYLNSEKASNSRSNNYHKSEPDSSRWVRENYQRVKQMKTNIFGRVMKKLSLTGTVNLSSWKDPHTWGRGRGMENNCLMGMGFPSGDMEMFWEDRWWLYNFVNVLNATEFFSFRSLILCYMNFTLILKRSIFLKKTDSNSFFIYKTRNLLL